MRQLLDQDRAALGAVVLLSPGSDLLALVANAGSPSSRRAAQRSGAGRQSRHGTESPAPAQATRIAVSLMSPVIGLIRTGVPAPRARATVPWPPWEMTSEAAGISWV